MEQAAIELEGVVKQRRTKTIGPVNLTLPEGYVIGLVGQNGAGKSTLIRMLIQQLFPDEGSIKWYGQDYKEGLPLALRQRITYVPEQANREENHLTAEQVMSFRSYWYEHWNHEIYENLMRQFEVPRRIKLSKLSKGERRKFELIMALAPEPRLLILDEPSSGLDPFASKMLIDQLRTFMNRENTTILLATHIVDEVRKIADYVMLMHQGQCLGMVEKDSLLDNWREIWVSGSADRVNTLPGVVSWQEELPGTYRMLTTDYQAIEQLLHASGLNLLKTRGLELDEILTLWIQGNMPKQ